MNGEYKKVVYLTMIIFVFFSTIFFLAIQQINKVPQTNTATKISEEDTEKYLESILLASNSKNVRNNTEFANIIDTINLKAIEEYSKKMNLSDEETQQNIDVYFQNRSGIITDIHKNMISREHYTDQTEFSYEYLDSINGFSESIAAFTCGVASFSYLTTLKGVGDVAKSGFTKYLAIKPICREIVTNVVNPVTQHLRRAAIVKDVDTMTIDLKDRVRSSILNLATARDTYHLTIDNIQTRTIQPFKNTDTFLRKFKITREAELNATAEANVVAGFDLNNFSINVQHESRMLSIHLPSPHILSNDVSVRFINEDREAFSPKIDCNSFNNVIAKAEYRALETAESSDLFQKAKDNALLSITNIFQSIMSFPQFNYTVKVYFDFDDQTITPYEPKW